MDVYVKRLQKQLDNALSKIDVGKDPIIGYFNRMQKVREFIKRLRLHVRKNAPPDRMSEINYLRFVTPFFYSRLYYCKMVYNLEIYRKAEDKSNFTLYMKKKLEGVKAYLFHYQKLHRYLHSNMRFWDKYIFTWETWAKDKKLLFSNGSRKAALILACERFRDFVQAELDKMKNPQPIVGTIWEGRKYTWERQDTDLVEVIYGFSGEEAIKVNGRKMLIKDYKIMFNDFFGIELGNVSDIKNGNLKRKIDQTPFLNSMIQANSKK